MPTKRFWVVSVTLLALATVIVLASSDWSYDGETGPNHWGDLSPDFAACSEGMQQSPIDITGGNGFVLPRLAFDYHATPIAIFNNTHTIEVEYEPGSTVNFLGNSYELVQFHFHTPSEHTFRGGAAFEVEMHLVHRNEMGNLLVVGVLIKRGASNAALEELWNYLPAVPNYVIHPEEEEINILDALPQDPAYFAYRGSLTTPPCSEGVTWIVLKSPIEMSREQIRKFQALMGITCCERNARPAQPLNGRQIFDGGADIFFSRQLPAVQAFEPQSRQ